MSKLYKDFTSKQAFTAWVPSIYFSPLETEPFVKVKVLGVFSYKGNVPTFKVVIKSTGAVFDFVPSSVVYTVKPKERVVVPENLGECSYKNCKSYLFTLYETDELRNKPCVVFDKEFNELFHGYYLLTMDWHTKNEQVNLVVSQRDSRVWFIPNHKMTFAPELKKEKLQGYKIIPERITREGNK